MKVFPIDSLHDLDAAAARFLTLTEGHRKFAFSGEMGSGKTTLIKAICKQLGAADTITSPTFALVNEYRTRHADLLYHFDLYRINRLEEMYDIGYEEYFFGDAWVFVEWAEKGEDLIPAFFVPVHMEDLGNGRREVTIDL
jgi:tRNA threonylcarbamoyladenosine biosynthesis protein TsaE